MTHGGDAETADQQARVLVSKNLLGEEERAIRLHQPCPASDR